MLIKTMLTALILTMSFNTYAIENEHNFPPSMSDLISGIETDNTQLTKEYITIFIPKGTESYKYVKNAFKQPLSKVTVTDEYNSQRAEELIAKAYLENQVKENSHLPDKMYLSNKQDLENGLLIDIDIRNSPEKKIIIEDKDSRYAIRYEYGRGYLYGIGLWIELDKNTDQQQDYLSQEFETYLINNGFKKKSTLSLFPPGIDVEYIKDNTVVKIYSEIKRPFTAYKRTNFAVRIENKLINKAYMESKSKDSTLKEDFDQLPNILK